MNTPVPSYLRLHRGDDPKSHTAPTLSSADQFWNAFSTATGWRIDGKHDSEEDVQIRPAVEMDLMASEPSDALPPVVKENAEFLAAKARELANEIRRLESVVRRQEIEMAAYAATEILPAEADSASEQIHQTLQRAIQAIGFDAAAIYMLDDDTQILNTRVVVGLPDDRLTADPRPLRGSRADLESMVQDAVLMEDLTGYMGETYAPPEDFPTAICTAVFRGDLPIGTLWLFAKKTIKLDQSHSAVAQLASSQITLQLSGAVKARREKRQQKSAAVVGEIAAWQFSGLPVGNHLAPGWFIDGMIESPLDFAIGWHHWDVLPDGSLMLAIAEATEMHGNGAMVAATARAALTAHCGYRHSPKQVLMRVSDTLWQTNAAEQCVSLLYARVDPETGEGELASAGSVSGLIAGPYGYRPLIQPGSPPLASELDPECFETTFNLADGETLLGFGSGLEREGISQQLLGCTLRKACQSDQNVLSLLRREIASFPNRHERGIVALSRRK